MSLFNNYAKPGRGTSHEEAEKREYFPILFRKITLLLKTNLLFFGVNIVLFALLAFFFMPIFISVDGQGSESYINHMTSVIRGKQLMSPFPFIVLWLFSPTVAGLTYLCRNYSRQIPVFLISDFLNIQKITLNNP